MEDHLEHLAELGITTIWLMPIHPIGTLGRKGVLGSPYSVYDYKAINPDFGTKEDLIRLVQKAHRLGLRVILDWVANHTSRDSLLIQNHPDWFYRDEDKNFLVPKNTNWTDVVGLDFSNLDLQKYLIEAMCYWVTEVDIDGFRCDVAGRVPTSFWNRVRKKLKILKPDIGLLAEAYKPELMKEAFDLTYDHLWYREVCRIIDRGAFTRTLWKTRQTYQKRFPSSAVAMRYIENHDQIRSLTRFGIGPAKAAAVLLMTWEGVPLLFNGQEFGSEAPTHGDYLFEKHLIDRTWINNDLFGLYKRLISLRGRSKALESGSIQNLSENTPRLLSFVRQCGDEQIFVFINMGASPITIDLPDPMLQDDYHKKPGATWEPILISEGFLNIFSSLKAEQNSSVTLDSWGFLIGSPGTLKLINKIF